MTFFATIGALVVILPIVFGMALLALIWRSWWLYPTWAWFFVPLGLPQISFWHFTAIITLLGVITQHSDYKKDDRKPDWSASSILFLWPVIVWVLMRWLH